MNGKPRIVNLTPHEIVVALEDGARRVFAPTGLARVIEDSEYGTPIDGIPIRIIQPGTVEGLPDPKADTYFLVSRVVLDAVPGREDVFAPDTGLGAIRDDQGRIVGVSSFCKIAPQN